MNKVSLVLKTKVRDADCILEEIVENKEEAFEQIAHLKTLIEIRYIGLYERLDGYKDRSIYEFERM